MLETLEIHEPDSEHCACPLCGADEPISSRYGSGVFQVVRCRRCGVWYLSPRLTEKKMAEFYHRADYFSSGPAGYDDYSRQERSLRSTFRAVLNRMAQKGMTGGAVLEIGCGYGYFLQEAKPFFDIRAGTDMSAAVAERAARHADDVFVGSVEAIPPDRKFDCIVALHVIEHIYRPREFLATLLGHLKGGGVLLLAAPDMNGFWRRLMGRKWPSFKFPEHVVFYDSRTLALLMRNIGLRDIVEVVYHHAFPLEQVFKKLGLPAIQWLTSTNVWLPATTVSVAGRSEPGSNKLS